MPAVNTSSTPQALVPYVGSNLAPSGPLDDLKKNPNERQKNKFTEALRLKYQVYKDTDYQAFIENCDVGRAVSNLRSGKLLLMRSVRDGRYLFVKRDGNFADNKTVGGQFQFYSTKLLAEWLSSKPERDPICPSDDDQIEEFIEAVKIVQDHYDRKFFDDEYETKECHSAQDFGTWITRFYFDPDKKDIACDLLDFPACRWDIRFRAEESSWFIYDQKCSNAKLAHILNAEIPQDGNDYQNYGLQVIEQLARVGGSIEGDGKNRPYGSYNNVQKENVVTQMWLQPEAYCDIELDDSEATLAGINLPSGDKLLEMFPTGMCVVGINQMQTIIGLYAENHKDHIVSGIYHYQSFSGVGKGLSDAVDVTKDLNDIHSQLRAHIKAHAMPSWGYNSNVMTEEMARNIGKGKRAIPIDFTQAPDGAHTINDVVQALLPGNPAQAAFEYKESLKNDLQTAMQVTDFSNGLPGVDNKTATGAKIGDANAETLLVPQHLNKANHRKRADVVIYNLFRRYMDVPKFFATKDLNPISKGQTIVGTQFLDVDIVFEIVANSEIPKTPYQQRDALSNLFQFTGGLPGLEQSIATNPELASAVVVAFGARLPLPEPQKIAKVCRKRVECAKKLLQVELQLQQVMSKVTGQQPDNANLADAIAARVEPRISPKEIYYQQKIEWLAALLDDDELQYAPPELRHVIESMIDLHLEVATIGQMQVAQDQNAAAVMANLPMVLGEQFMSQRNQQMDQAFQQEQMAQQQQVQQQQVEQQNQQALQMEGQKAQIQDKASEADHQRALALSEKSHAQNLQITALNHLATVEREKAKPPSKPSPARR